MAIRCPKIIEPAVKVMYSEFPKFVTNTGDSGMSISITLLAAAFILLLALVILTFMYLLKLKNK